MMTEKKVTKADRAREVMRQYPRLAPKKVAKRAGVDVQTVYQVRSDDRRRKLKPATKRDPGIDGLVATINAEIAQTKELRRVVDEIAKVLGVETPE